MTSTSTGGGLRNGSGQSSGTGTPKAIEISLTPSSSSQDAGSSIGNTSNANGTSTTAQKLPAKLKQSSNVFGMDVSQKLEIDDLRDQFKKNNRIREFASHSNKVHSVDWNCDGRRLASGSFDKTVAVYAFDNTKLKVDHTCKGHADSVDQLCWHVTSPDLLATASGDKTVRVWDTRQQRNTHCYPTKGENINITWSGDGNYIATGNKDDLLTFIDIRQGNNLLEEQFKFEVNEITWDPTGKFFFLTNGEGNVCIYSFPEFQLKHTLKAHTANCICIEFHPSGDYFAVGSADAIVSLWTSDTLACIRTYTRLDWPVRAISFNYNGSLIAAASEDLVIDISHTETSEKIFQIPVETPTFTVSFHPTRNILAFACDDKDKYDRERDSGVIKVFGLPSD